MSVPARSDDQRLAALRRANEIRTYRAQLKRDLAAGRANAAAVIQSPDDRLLTMKVYELLLAIPKVGRVKANKVIQKARVSPSKTLGGLSERQRCEILGLLAIRSSELQRHRDMLRMRQVRAERRAAAERQAA